MGHGFNPWSGKIPHAVGQLSSCATITEPPGPQLLKPERLKPVLHNKKSHLTEKPAYHNKESPLLAATRENLHEARDSPQPINKQIFLKIDGCFLISKAINIFLLEIPKKVKSVV